MKQRIFIVILFVIGCQSLLAQKNINQVLTDWYLEERFILADQDKDALLDVDELNQFPQEFGYYLDARNFLLSDSDGDGKLSFRETKTRVIVEFNFRFAKEIAALNALRKSGIELGKLNASELKNNPALASRLLGNLYWMNNNAALAKAVYQDKTWMLNNGDVLASLQRNLCWLVTHPADAKSLYKPLNLRHQARELMSWRSAHKQLLRTYNELPNDIVLSFLPRK